MNVVLEARLYVLHVNTMSDDKDVHVDGTAASRGSVKLTSGSARIVPYGVDEVLYIMWYFAAG